MWLCALLTYARSDCFRPCQVETLLVDLSALLDRRFAAGRGCRRHRLYSLARHLVNPKLPPCPCAVLRLSVVP